MQLSPVAWKCYIAVWAHTDEPPITCMSWVIIQLLFSFPRTLTIEQKWAFLLVLFLSSFPCCLQGLSYSLPLTSRWSSNPGSAQPYLTLESRQNRVCLPQHNSHKLNSMALPQREFFCGWCNFSIWSAIFDVYWRQVQLGWRAYVALLKSNLGFFGADINSWLYCAGHAR